MTKDWTAAQVDAFEKAVRDEELSMAYAEAEVSPEGGKNKPPSWWHGDEEASDLAVGWGSQAARVDGVNV